MRVTHDVHPLDGLPDAEVHLLQGRYRVYWTNLPDCTWKAFGVVDMAAQGSGLPLKDFVLLDAQHSDGRAHAIRMATAANTLEATARLLGLGFSADGLAVTA